MRPWTLFASFVNHLSRSTVRLFIFAMTSPGTPILSSRPIPLDEYLTPAQYTPLTPPSTGASSPYRTCAQCPPHLVHVTQRLLAESQDDTRRFPNRNRLWPDKEEYLLDLQDDEATMVNGSLRTHSRCSQTTLCGPANSEEDSGSPAHEYNVAATRSLKRQPGCCQKALPPAPTDDFAAWPKDLPIRPRKSSLAASSTPGPRSPRSPREVSLPIDTISSLDPRATTTDRISSWPTFTAQRPAPQLPVPQPPAMDEISAFDDSDSEEDTESGRLRRLRQIRRRVSNPLRALWCTSKPPRRKSA